MRRKNGNSSSRCALEHRPVRLQHLDEAAHVRAFEMVRQVDGELHGGDGALRFAGAEADADGEAQVFHADAVDGDAAVVGFALRVAQGGGAVVRALHGGGR